MEKNPQCEKNVLKNSNNERKDHKMKKKNGKQAKKCLKKSNIFLQIRCT